MTMLAVLATVALSTFALAQQLSTCYGGIVKFLSAEEEFVELDISTTRQHSFPYFVSSLDNKISAVEITTCEDVRVVLYEHRNYWGDGKELTETTYDLGAEWNVKVSSFRVYIKPPPSNTALLPYPVGCVRVFDHTIFVGTYNVFCGNVANLADKDPEYDNTISAFSISDDFVASFYSDVGYQGDTTYERAGNGNVVSTLNNRISSIKFAHKRPSWGSVRLFTYENFEGVTRELWGNMTNLATFGWDNMIASAIVGPGCGATFYQDYAWEGGSTSASAGYNYTVRNLAWFSSSMSRNISSIKVFC